MISKKGSATIEAAITFSAILILTSAMLSYMMFNKADIIMQRAVEESTNDFSQLTPLMIPAGDGLSTIINCLPEGIISSEDVENIVTDIAGGILSINDFTGGELGNFLLSSVFSGIIRDDIGANYTNLDGPQIVDIDSISVYLSLNPAHNAIDVYVSYDFTILAGTFSKSIYSVIPLYGSFDLYIDDGGNNDERNEIWDTDNFTRGNYFRNRFGANMPGNFPVVSRFSNGNITSIKSIDLTAPTYSDNNRIDEAVIERIDLIAEFDGGESVYNGQRYEISSDEIRSRTLIIVIPGNSPAERSNEIESLSGYASSRGVNIQIVTYAESQRYLSDE